MDETKQPIYLAPMSHLSEAKCAEDDWAGISDWSTRKRRQNRLNQRAYRRRKALKAECQGSGHDRKEDRCSDLEQGRFIQVHDESSGAGLTYNDHEQQSHALTVKVASKTITFDPFEYCPLPSDHLLSLIRYNLYRAVAANSWSLGIDPRLMHSDIPSPFISDDPAISSFCLSLPPSLRPTALQRNIPHHPYIDLFPFPPMRDFLLQFGDSIDEDVLCADFAGENLHSDFGEHTGLIVWGEPWDPHSWEIAEPLWKKWSWVLRGCSEILEATNYWRQRRGEPRLVDIT